VTEAVPDPNAERAQALGRRCISMMVAQALYGLPLEDVQEVIGMRSLTRVFHAPPAVAGVTSLRGEVLPVIDLGVLLGRASGEVGEAARIVVVREKGGLKRWAGLRVDELGPLREVPAEGLSTPPTTLSDAAQELVVGVISEAPPCSVLRLSSILASPLLAGVAAGKLERET